MKSKRLLPILRGAAFMTAVRIGSLAHSQIPEGWEIVEIFPAGTEFYCGPPDINDKGQIVFARRLWPDFDQQEIILYDRGELIQLTDDDVTDWSPRINNHGEIVWSRDLDPDPEVRRQAIVRWRDGAIETIAEPPEHYNLEAPDINDAGLIVWQTASFGITPYRASVQLFDGFSTVTVPNDGLADQSPRINNTNQIAWARYDLRRNRNTIMRYDRGAIHPISNGLGQPQKPNINDLGQIVWGDQQTGLYHWSGGTASRLIASSAILPTINDCGEISFSHFDPTNGVYQLSLLEGGGLPLQLTSGQFGGVDAEASLANLCFNRIRSPNEELTNFVVALSTWILIAMGTLILMTIRHFSVVSGRFGVTWTAIAVVID